MNILITGVAGLLGSRFADWIIENHPECTVIGIDNLFGGYIENVNDKVIFYKRDLQYDNISDIFENHKIDYVYHFAAYAAEGLSPFMRKFNYQNNIGSTMNIVNNCITYKVKRLVYTSSMSVYGHGSSKRFDENDPLVPIDPYGISKMACEMDIRVAGIQHGLDWCIIRPHNVYGEKQNIWDKYRNVLGIWMYKMLNDQDLLVYGDGEQVRAFSYIADNMLPFWRAAMDDKVSKEIINVGGIEGITINNAADLLCDITGYPKNRIIHTEPRHEVKIAVPDHQKSIDVLGYEQNTDLRTGLTQMWNWAQKQPIRKQYVWENYEINDKLYSFWK